MSHFRPFEAQALHMLVDAVLGSETAALVVSEAELVSYEYSGCGYFVTVKHEALPVERKVCGEPIVTAKSGDVDAGYIAFIENGQLMLECYTAGAIEVPKDFRERQVVVAEQPNIYMAFGCQEKKSPIDRKFKT
jgi:hypothetical protein